MKIAELTAGNVISKATPDIENEETAASTGKQLEQPKRKVVDLSALRKCARPPKHDCRIELHMRRLQELRVERNQVRKDQYDGMKPAFRADIRDLLKRITLRHYKEWKEIDAIIGFHDTPTFRGLDIKFV